MYNWSPCISEVHSEEVGIIVASGCCGSQLFGGRGGHCFLCTFGSKMDDFEGGGGRYRETNCYRMSLLYSKIVSKHCYL